MMRLEGAIGGEVGLCRNGGDLRGGAVHADTVGLVARYETRVWEVLLAPWGVKYGR